MLLPTHDLDFAAMSAAERLLLAHELLDSVLYESMPLTPSQIADVESRLADIDSGREVCESWDSVRERLLREFK